MPRELEEIVMTALARAPEQRFVSARAFGAALQGFLAGLGLGAGASRVAGYLRRLFGTEPAERRRRLEAPVPPTMLLPRPA
jgi:hypothetical protein